MKRTTKEQKQENRLIKSIVKNTILEFLTIGILLLMVEILHFYWVNNRQYSLLSLQLDWVFTIKSMLVGTLLTRVTLIFAEYRETRSVVLNPEKTINLELNKFHLIVLFICTILLGYVISTYTMLTESPLAHILFITGIYILCAVRVILFFATTFYQKILYDYYKDQEA